MGVPFQLINDDTEELRYLALSGLNETDVFEYPDSCKLGLVTGGGGPMRGPQRRIFLVALETGAGYWQDEPTEPVGTKR